jgi:uncharacterized protein YndB with AHSA1/START domain
MTQAVDPNLDLTISRIIRAPRAVIWKAYTDPERFSQWWVPAPARCRVLEMEIAPGGAFITEISEDGGPFAPHMSACFLAADEMERLVFTNALLGGWRPAEHPFMTAIISLKDHPEGTDYTAHVMHRSNADRNMHEELGFYDGWGTVIEQLATLVENS